MKPIAQNTLLQNRYLIVHMIGKGGMGEVYLAIDQRLGSAVALKRTLYSDDELLGNAFEREARTLARLRHPVLTKVSDHFVENETQFLVMEHISGEDLSKRMEINKKGFPLSWVLFWADQLLDALTYLHTHEPPIIHRDIKPQNLKLTAENNIVLLDFGLSKNTIGQTKTSTSGSVVGYTPHYAPMEQIRGMGTDERSDLFSLSATLYQLLSNVIPVDALNRADSILSGMSDPLTPLNELNQEVSKDLSDVLLKGMALSLDQRYATARDMQKALREAYAELKNQDSSALPENTNNRPPAEIPQSQLATEVISLSDITDQNINYEISKSGQSNSTNSLSEPAQTDSLNTYSAKYPEERSEQTDFDATIRYNSAQENSEEIQSNIKTEVFIAGSLPVLDSVQKDEGSKPKSYIETADFQQPKAFAEADNFSADEDFGAADDNFGATENYSPDATLPLIPYAKHLDQGVSAPANDEFNAEFDDRESQSETPEFSAASDYDAAEQEVSIPQTTSPPTSTLPNKKSSANKLIIAGGVGVLLILLISVAGLGWYALRSSKNIAVEQTPLPTPQPTMEISPTPEPSLEAVTETNSNSSIGESLMDSNSESLTNANSSPGTIGQSVTKDVKTPREQTTPVKTEVQKRTPQTVSEKTPSTQAERTPAPKKTPVKSDRTDILQ